MFFNRLVHTVTVTTLTTSKDADGGTTQTWTSVATGVPCLISLGNGSRPGRFEQPGNIESFTVTSNSEFFGTQSHRFTVTSGPGEGYTFYITGISAHGPAGWIDRFYRTTCEWVQP